jgi:hypothetical protein
MRWIYHAAGVSILSLMLCSAGSAQSHRVGGFTAGRTAFHWTASRNPAPFRQTTSSLTVQNSARGRVVMGHWNGQSIATASENDFIVPGLGFDYPHLAAISGNIPGVRRNRMGEFGQGGGFITPIFFGGFGGYGYADTLGYPPVQQEPQVIVLQQPTPVVVFQQVPPAPQASDNVANPNRVTPEKPVPPAPVRDVGEFVLIRRDGRVLFAAGYTLIGTNLRYITPEGIQHTLPLAELDVTATRAMNEARGSVFTL